MLAKAYPGMSGVGCAEAWGGTIDSTPDAVPVISAVDKLKGFHLATGFSGHGFGIGPAAGRLAADIVAGDTRWSIRTLSLHAVGGWHLSGACRGTLSRVCVLGGTARPEQCRMTGDLRLALAVPPSRLPLFAGPGAWRLAEAPPLTRQCRRRP
ncbi:NAD(P)/FAD-dependent oxidoreductase [Pseudoroseomonas wenyumeiae]